MTAPVPTRSRPGPPTAAARPPSRTRRLLPLVLVSLQLQIPTVALGPVLVVIASQAGLSQAQAGALTSIPVFCFALLTPVAPALIGRIGLDRSLVIASLAIGVGVLVRSQGSVAALYAGSVLLGAAIAIVNISIPTFVTRHFRHRALQLTGINTAATNIGSATAAAVSAPVVALLGWQLGLAVWSLASFVAAGAWWLGSRGSAGAGADPRPVTGTAGEPAAAPSRSASSALRIPMAWVLGLTFAMHGMCYFAVSSWLPSLLGERSGLSPGLAGACVAVFMALGILGPLVLPGLLRLPGVRLWMLMTATTVGWLSCIVVLAALPGWWAAAVLLGGLAQGACFTVIVTFGVHVARDEAQSRGIQAVLQTVGFAGAALGPTLIGAVLDRTGAWEPVLVLLVGVASALVVFGGVASRLLVRFETRAAQGADGPVAGGTGA
ncbi:MAG: hypothetical protein BGO96_10880 [Micrococcales bacterium 73-15]|uniref:MFS transporter n=1 Tax=Salana multivorans TaxID=120377 RepID=UPI0009662F4F|nr:MFS transporter [Salana multivorans]OJX95341.1 MAG: hypothetical protein BGO96_10880 [Micrococcales bacterium 73-15]